MPIKEIQAKEQSFQLINRTQNPSNLQSSLYRLIQDLYEENHDLTIGTICEFGSNEETGREYAILKPPVAKMEIQKTLNFQCKEYHITIDKVYAQDNTRKGLSGFAISHYTGTYNDTRINKDFKVRCYFNEFGRYSYCKVSAFQEMSSEISEGLISELTSIAIKDCQYAEKLLGNFLQEKNSRYLDAVEESFEVECSFKTLFRKLYNYNTPDTETDYQQLINIAKKFDTLIVKINRYCDKQVDFRNNLIKQALRQLRDEQKLGKGIEELSINEKEDIPIACSHKNTQLEKLFSKQEELFQQIYKNYQSFKEIKNPNNCPVILIKQHEIIDQIDLLILEFFILTHRSCITKKIDYKQLKLIEADIIKVPSLLTIFQQKCYEFDEESIKFLLGFEVVQNGITIDFCGALLTQMLNTQIAEEKVVAVGNILFEKSQIYREFIIRCTNFDGMFFLHEKHKGTLFSIPVMALMKHKYKLLEMIFNQGLNLNGIGMMDVPFYANLPMSLILMSYCVDKNMLTKIIDLLVKHNATIDFEENQKLVKKWQPYLSSELAYEQLEDEEEGQGKMYLEQVGNKVRYIFKICKDKTIKGYLNTNIDSRHMRLPKDVISKIMTKTMSDMLDLTSIPGFKIKEGSIKSLFNLIFKTTSYSFLEFVCTNWFKYESYNSLQDNIIAIKDAAISLANNTRLQNICFSFAKLLDLCGFSFMFFESIEPEIFISYQLESFEQVFKNKFKKNNSLGYGNRAISLLFFLSKEKNTPLNPNIIILIEGLFNIINKKLKSSSFDDIFGNTGIYSKLFLDAFKNKSDKDKGNSNLICLNACLMLLVAKPRLQFNSEHTTKQLANVLNLTIEIQTLNQTKQEVLDKTIRTKNEILDWLLTYEQQEEPFYKKALYKFTGTCLKTFNKPKEVQKIPASFFNSYNQGALGCEPPSGKFQWDTNNRKTLLRSKGL